MVYRRTPGVCARQHRTRASIIEATRSLVATAGFEGASVAEVAASAGVGVGTVYRYFPSKADLVTEVVREVCRHELEVVASVAHRQTGSPTERLVAAVTVFAQRALRSGRVAYAMIAEPTVAEAEALRLEIRAELAGILAAVVADGVEVGEFPTQSPGISGAALVGAVSEVLVGPLSPRTPADVDTAALVDEIGRFALRSVAPHADTSIEELNA